MHKLKTVKDILEVVTPENIDNFLTDFVQFVQYATEVKEHVNTLKKHGVKLDMEPVDTMEWIDDDKNEIHAHVHVRL